MSIHDVIALEKNGPYLPADLLSAEIAWANHREDWGFKANGKSKLVKVGGNNKIKETAATLTLSAGSESQFGMCVNDSSCKAVCVVEKSVRGEWTSVQRARNCATQFLIKNPMEFAAILRRDLLATIKKGIEFCRLNTNSDLAWEKIFPWIEDMDIKFYDYTKSRSRVRGDGYVLPNYRLTYSAIRSTSLATVKRLINEKATVTMVFARKKDDLPDHWNGITVVSGDSTDIRYSDPQGVIVGLSAKGKLKGITSHPLLIPIPDLATTV